MKTNLKLIIISILCILIMLLGFLVVSKYVFLAPNCYSDNKNLNESENYFIKKQVLEVVEDRLSFFGDKNSRKHLFVLINSDFMDTVEKNENGYIVRVNTYNMEEDSDDCVYEIQFSKDLDITSFELDP